MVAVGAIVDRQSLADWLLDRSDEKARKFAIAIAHRSAMRVLPVYWSHAIGVSMSGESGEAAEKALLVLRCHLLASLCNSPHRHRPIIEQTANRILKTFTYESIYFALRLADEAGFPGDENSSDIDLAGATALTALSVGLSADSGFVELALSTTGGYISLFGAGVDQLNKALLGNAISDCKKLAKGKGLMRSPLWNGNQNPFQTQWDALRQSPNKTQHLGYGLNYGQSYGGARSVDWSFWIKWYQDALEGREPDWDMLAEIALIPGGDWKKGPEHINNQVIAGIVEKYRLLRDVQALRKELAAVRQTATAAPMGHNNPPEGIEAEAEVVTQTEIIWAALEEAEEELSKPEPSPSDLKRIGTAILKALGEIGKYGAKLVDVALKAVAGTVGAGVGAHLISKGPEIQSVAERILDYVGAYLP